MPVLFPGKFVYLAHPHTGSSATVLALQDTYPEALDVRPHHMSYSELVDPDNIARISQQRERVWKGGRPVSSRRPEVRPEDLISRITGTEWRFCVVRNPYDFFVSCYLRQRHNTNSPNLEHFVASFRRPPFVVDGKIWYLVDDCDEVFLYENLQDHFDGLADRLGLKRIKIERKNATPNKDPWESYYTPRAFEIVNNRFGKEIEKFYELRE